jgi:hypothetical protein
MLGPDGEEGKDALSEMVRKYSGLPQTPTARSGSGGKHHCYRWPADGNICNRKNHRGVPIDVRGEGGYFVAAPSVNGVGPYEWEIPPGKCDPAEAPAWLLDWVRGKEQKSSTNAFKMHATNGTSIVDRAIAYLAKMPAAISSQGGHDQTMEAARVVVYGFDLGVETGYQIINAHYNPRCQPSWSEKELRHKCDEADKVPFGKPRGWLLNGATGNEGQGNGNGAPEPWDDPLPLDTHPPVPPFPVELLPTWVSQYVASVAEATQTPADLAAMLSLAHIGATIASKIRVQIREGWSEPTNIYTVTALESGERKSAVYAATMAPAYEFEREMREAMAPIIASAKAEHALLEARQKHLAGLCAKEKDANKRNDLREQTKQAARELAMNVIPEDPQIVVDDIPPEKLTQVIIRQGGRILQAAPEGTPFEIAKGRYSESANFDIYLKGHSGDPLRIDRISRGREAENSPALSVALAVQPDVVRGLADEATMRTRGFLARYFYAIPISIVGNRRIAPPAVSPSVTAAFQANMLTLWRITGAVDKNGKPTPAWVRFSPEADTVLREFERWLEPQLGEGGRLAHLAGWANKLAGGTARIAAILHMATAIAGGNRIPPAIDAETAEASIRIGRDYLLPHALAAFALMGANPHVSEAKRLLAWLSNSVNCVNSVTRDGKISKRDMHAKVFGGQYCSEEVDAVVGLLVKRGYLRLFVEPQRQGAGRKPSPRYEIHPSVLQAASWSQNSQNSQNREPGEEG